MPAHDIETLKAAKPYIKYLVAFCLKLRNPIKTQESCVAEGEAWVQGLIKEVERG